MEMQAELEIFAERQLLARPRRGVAIAGDRPRLHRRSAASDRTLDAVLHHEIEPARVGADNRLPAFDGQVDRARHESKLLELVAAVGNLWGKRIVFPLMRE